MGIGTEQYNSFDMFTFCRAIFRKVEIVGTQTITILKS